MDYTYYPLHDFGPMMKGMIIGGLGIFHVFVAQFAIGGGILMCYFQWLAQTGRNAHARRFLDSFFQVLVLISFVTGAVTGVAMWFTCIQISPRTIGLMVDEFHWIWATEWTFFATEIFTGYLFYRYGPRLPNQERMILLALYAFAAWCSLFWINGILSWQLTPDGWPLTRKVWDGFFNPSFWPSLLFRTVASMSIAALAACVVINAIRDLDQTARASLINHASLFLAPLILAPFLGWWYLLSVPGDSLSYVLGGSTPMTMFLLLTAGCSGLVGLHAFVALLWRRLSIDGFTAALLCLLAFAAAGFAEFVREGIRKPYSARQALYSNSITEQEVGMLRAKGSVTLDPYPLLDGESHPNSQVRLGAKVFRFQCGVCHTLKGVNGVTHLTSSWSTEQERMNLAKLQHTKPFMPPFAGNAAELEALVQMIDWLNAGCPKDWPPSNDEAVLRRLDRWIKEAGTEPGKVKDGAMLIKKGTN
ncbi:MAG: cytochrome ubiquinol oxidase subunit I [Verrucomicrobiae bacterium]|nr:cytochrome ubiquinol oxidase subunit I [Verrucomicrobiae bacterium]